jgi:excisionase family DNA binding protein
LPALPTALIRLDLGGVKREPIGFEIDDMPATVLTIEELSGYLKIPKSTLYKLAQEGKLPGQKVGRHWRFHRRAVDAWLMKAGAMAESAEAPSVAE